MKNKRDENLDMLCKAIGKRIRGLRNRRGCSQKIIADLLGISVPAFWKIESGTTDVSISRLNQIADIFKIKASALLDDEDLDAQHKEETQMSLMKDKLIKSEEEVIKLQKRLLMLYENLEKYITKSC